MDNLIEYLRNADPLWVYCALFLGSYVENVLPPVPGDTVIVFGAYLVGRGVLDYALTYIVSTIGSLTGFMTMYGAGRFLDKKVIETGKWRFFSGEAFHKIERWFEKYGYCVIAANRFLSGARSVVSLFAGIVRLNAWIVLLLAGASCILWNAIILYAGAKVGEHWEIIVNYLKQYNVIVLLIITIICALFIVKTIKNKKIKF